MSALRQTHRVRRWPPWWRSGCSATGCSVVSKVAQDVHNVEGNKATIDSFTQNLQSGQSTPFEATYTTTGSAPATVVYAVDPSSGGLAFHETQTGANASNLQVIVNSSGEYACNQSGSGGAWSLPEARQGRRRVARTRSSTSTRRRTGSPSSRGCRWWPGWPATR